MVDADRSRPLAGSATHDGGGCGRDSRGSGTNQESAFAASVSGRRNGKKHRNGDRGNADSGGARSPEPQVEPGNSTSLAQDVATSGQKKRLRFNDGGVAEDSSESPGKVEDEACYVASVAKERIAAAEEVEYPEVRTKAPRLLCEVWPDPDMSKVNLVSSSDSVGTSMFPSSEKATATLDVERTWGLMSSLMDQTRSFYSLSPPVHSSNALSPGLFPPDTVADSAAGPTSTPLLPPAAPKTSSSTSQRDTDSIVSSMTDSNSGSSGGNNGGDERYYNDCDEEEGESSESTLPPDSSIKSHRRQSSGNSSRAYIRMGKALARSKSPRYVLFLCCVSYLAMGQGRLTLWSQFISFPLRLISHAYAPFVVVHVNEPYTRLTSKSSSKILGRPLHELLDDPVVAAALQTSCQEFSLKVLNEQTVTFDNSEGHSKGVQCKIGILPIGNDEEHITHYALNLKYLRTVKGCGSFLSAKSNAAGTVSAGSHQGLVG